MKEKETLVKLGGLWAGRDPQGNLVASGYLGSARLLVFKNGYKREDKHPDYIMYLANPEKREEQATETKDDFPF